MTDTRPAAPSAISRRTFSSLAALPAFRSAASAQRRNVLLIAVDDLTTELGCYGSRNVHTPNIDRLARTGVLFEQNHCQFPLCQPSRASFLSGRRPDTTGVYTLKTRTRVHLSDTLFLPEFFRRNGYYSAHAGKVYHTGNPAEDPRSWDDELRDSGDAAPEPSTVLRRVKADGPKGHSFEWDVLNLTADQTPDGITTRKAVSYIEKSLSMGKPFFVGAGIRRPHSPYAAPRSFFDGRPWRQTALPSSPPGQLRKILKAALNYGIPDEPLSEETVRQFRAAYFACVDFVDSQIGVLLEAMDRLKLWRNTVVAFIVDHGYHLGDHGGLWHKESLFENGTRVPLIVYAPDQPANGKASRRLTESVDLYPTLTELCGFGYPEGLEGVSLVPLLQDPARRWKRGAFSMVARGEEPGAAPEKIAFLGRTVRTERWRYTEWDDAKRGVELYDHSSDAGELNNLADSSRFSGTLKELRGFLRDGWQAAAPPPP